MTLISVNEENFVAQIAGQCDITEPITKDVLQRQYPTLFEGLGKLEGELHLRIDATLQPTKIPTRKVPISLKTDQRMNLIAFRNLQSSRQYQLQLTGRVGQFDCALIQSH